MMLNEVTDQPNGSWDAAYRIETARVSIFPCDALASREAAGVLADPVVYESYCGARSAHLDRRDAEACWAQHVDDYPRFGRMNLAARQRASSEFVGMVRFNEGWLTYFVSPRYWGNGYGTEMVGECCRTMPRLLNLKVVRARVIRENIGSRRILEKIGFAFAGLTNRSWPGRPGALAVLQYQLHVA